VLRALALLGLDADLDLLAANDTLGRKLQDGRFPQRRSEIQLMETVIRPDLA
jgi:hypothetical protein